MQSCSPDIGDRARHHAARLLFLASLALVGLRGTAAATCGVAFDPAEIERFNKMAAEQAATYVPPPPPMSTEDLAKELRKAKVPQADLVASVPGFVEEWSLDFLSGGTHLKVTLDGPYRTQVLQFVHQGKRYIPIERGRAGRERIASDVRLSVRDADGALRYARWLLDVTGEGGIWLVGSVDEVPFPPFSKNLAATHTKEAVAAARQDLEGKIQPPRAEESGNVFVVQQDAVVAQSLVRYKVKVSKLGLATIAEETIARDLPVSVARAAP